MSTSKLTELEKQVLEAILNSDYQDDDDPVNNPVWYLQEHDVDMEKGQLSGAISSCVKKGYVITDIDKKDNNKSTIWLTQEGYDMLVSNDKIDLRKVFAKEVKDKSKEFINKLKEAGLELAPNAVCRLNIDNIELCISVVYKRTVFASDITLYSNRESILGHDRLNEINFGSSGSFTPDNKASYWRTIHASEVLKNWDVVSEIVNDTCTWYSDRLDYYVELNKA